MFARMALQGVLGNRVKGVLPQIIGLRETSREPTRIERATGRKRQWKNIAYDVIDVNRPDDPPLANVKAVRTRPWGSGAPRAYIDWFGEGRRTTITDPGAPKGTLTRKQVRAMLKAFVSANPEFDTVEGTRVYYGIPSGTRRRLRTTRRGSLKKTQTIDLTPIKKQIPGIKLHGKAGREARAKLKKKQGKLF
jgi:hypothetical protein